MPRQTKASVQFPIQMQILFSIMVSVMVVMANKDLSKRKYCTPANFVLTLTKSVRRARKIFKIESESHKQTQANRYKRVNILISQKHMTCLGQQGPSKCKAFDGFTSLSLQKIGDRDMNSKAHSQLNSTLN